MFGAIAKRVALSYIKSLISSRDIQKLLLVIVKLVKEEFTEDNDATTLCFLVSKLVDAYEEDDVSVPKTLINKLRDIVD